MAITSNTSKPTTSLSNSSRPGDGETWASITTTWASETRTWQGIGSFIVNTYTNFGFLWSIFSTPWTMTAPWTTNTGITNTTKVT